MTILFYFFISLHCSLSYTCVVYYETDVKVVTLMSKW